MCFYCFVFFQFAILFFSFPVLSPQYQHVPVSQLPRSSRSSFPLFSGVVLSFFNICRYTTPLLSLLFIKHADGSDSHFHSTPSYPTPARHSCLHLAVDFVPFSSVNAFLVEEMKFPPANTLQRLVTSEFRPVGLFFLACQGLPAAPSSFQLKRRGQLYLSCLFTTERNQFSLFFPFGFFTPLAGTFLALSWLHTLFGPGN